MHIHIHCKSHTANTQFAGKAHGPFSTKQSCKWQVSGNQVYKPTFLKKKGYSLLTEFSNYKSVIIIQRLCSYLLQPF